MSRLTLEAIKLNPIEKHQFRRLNKGMFSYTVPNKKYIRCIAMNKQLNQELFLIDLKLVDQGYLILARKVEKVKVLVQERDPFSDEHQAVFSRYVFIVEYELKKYMALKK